MRKSTTESSKIVSNKKLNELKFNACKILFNCRQTLLARQPFVGTIAMGLNIKPVRDNRLETAATDGKNIFFDIDFLSRLNNEERVFIIAHEVWHNVLCHFLRTENRDREIFNIATDIEVNEILIAEGFSVPKNACLAKTFGFTPGLSAEEYYDLLIKKNNKNNQPNNNANGSESSNDSSSGSNSTNNCTSQIPANDGTNCNGQFDKHIYNGDRYELDDGNEGVDDRYGKVGRDADYQPNVNEHTIEQIREQAITAAQMIEKQAGSLPAYLQRLVNKMLEPQIPWQEVLCQFVSKCHGAKVKWSTPNRRFVHSGIYLPSHEDNCINVVVGIDASASTDTHLPKFLGELNSLVKSFAGYTINLIEADTMVHKHEIYNDDNPLDLEHTEYEMSGGGGTELHSIFDYVTDNDIDADAIIMFTDGDNSTTFYEDEQPTIPVLWMITPDGTDEYIHFGSVIKL